MRHSHSHSCEFLYISKTSKSIIRIHTNFRINLWLKNDREHRNISVLAVWVKVDDSHCKKCESSIFYESGNTGKMLLRRNELNGTEQFLDMNSNMKWKNSSCWNFPSNMNRFCVIGVPIKHEPSFFTPLIFVRKDIGQKISPIILYRIYHQLF